MGDGEMVISAADDRFQRAVHGLAMLADEARKLAAECRSMSPSLALVPRPDERPAFLIVDDDRQDAELIGRWVSRDLSAPIVFATSLQGVLEAIARNWIVGAVIDWHVPESDAEHSRMATSCTAVAQLSALGVPGLIVTGGDSASIVCGAYPVVEKQSGAQMQAALTGVIAQAKGEISRRMAGAS